MSTLTEKEKDLLKEAKLTMLLADQQEKSADTRTQQEAEHNRQRLLRLLSQLHVVNTASDNSKENETRSETLTRLWDAWVLQHAAPEADLLSRPPYAGDCGKRILRYVKQADGFEGTLGRLANAVGAAKSTVHDALQRLEKENKISVEKTNQRKFIVVAL